MARIIAHGVAPCCVIAAECKRCRERRWICFPYADGLPLPWDIMAREMLAAGWRVQRADTGAVEAAEALRGRHWVGAAVCPNCRIEVEFGGARRDDG